jgi:hypothetical protein
MVQIFDVMSDSYHILHIYNSGIMHKNESQLV